MRLTPRAVLADMGGVMTEEDLASHYTTFPTPIMTNYRGVTPTPISDPWASNLALHLRKNVFEA